jgi:hypothetical protein
VRLTLNPTRLEYRQNNYKSVVSPEHVLTFWTSLATKYILRLPYIQYIPTLYKVFLLFYTMKSTAVLTTFFGFVIIYLEYY